MGFFTNVNARPRIGTISMHPDRGFSVFTETGWKYYDYDNIFTEARVVEVTDRVSIDIDEIFGKHISNEEILYELMLRARCRDSNGTPMPFATIAYIDTPDLSRADSYTREFKMYTKMVAAKSSELHINDQKILFRGWFEYHDFMADLLDRCPVNSSSFLNNAITYYHTLKDSGQTYRFIDKNYMQH